MVSPKNFAICGLNGSILMPEGPIVEVGFLWRGQLALEL